MTPEAIDPAEPDGGPEALAERIIEIARRKNARITTAESCTGGLLGHLLTEVAGASEVYVGGWVVYANERKVQDLNVHADLLERAGAVSQPVAETLAQSARRQAHVTIAVATTGIAGPTGGTPDKPVGTCWIALATPDGVEARRVLYPDRSRADTKRAFATAAFTDVLAALERHASFDDAA